MKIKMILIALTALLSLASCGDDDSGIQLTQDEIIGDINTGKKIVITSLTTYTESSSKVNDKSNSFNLRLARVSLDGRILDDFYWKAQIQFNGNTTDLGNSPRVVDLFAEWQKYGYFKIKAGQFKRPFSFENPMHPVDQGFMSYSQITSSIAGFNDRAGAHASNGRDIGVQLQGDFLPNANGRNLLHYQVGVFNGQGINVKDVDQRKDIIGGVWVMPVAGMRIGAFGWTGSYARKRTVDTDHGKVTEILSLPQRRYALSAEYVTNDWTFRSEYAHSTGLAFKTRYQKPENATDFELSKIGDKGARCLRSGYCPNHQEEDARQSPL